MTSLPITPDRFIENWFLDVSAERVVAGARLLLILFALVAVATNGDLEGIRAQDAYVLLGVYLIWALAIRVTLFKRPLGKTVQRITHYYDICVVSVLMFLTDSPASSSYFVFFSFILISATLLFGWIEVLLTAALLTTLFAAMILSELFLFGDPDPTIITETNRVILRSAYLFAVGGMLGYIRAYRDYSQQRLATLAKWPAAFPSDQKFPALETALSHAAQVLRVPSLLVLRKYVNEADLLITSYGPDGICQERKSADHFAEIVSPDVAGIPFASNDVTRGPILTVSGEIVRARTRYESFPALTSEFTAAYRLRSVAGAPFGAQTCSGWIFALGRSHWREDDLSLLQIVAANIANELEQHAMAGQRADAAALRERISLGRELHDSILQGLTAARLRLQAILEQVEGTARAALGEVRDLLTNEQRRLREFVDAAPVVLPSAEATELRTDLHGQIDDLQRQWSCHIALTIQPAGLVLPPRFVRELKFIVSEAVANAVNHGKAKLILIHVAAQENLVNVRVEDDGVGFAASGGPSKAAVSPPKSLRIRVDALGGSLAVENSFTGAVLLMRLPVA
jgi:signal transduction histidine kinase